MDELINSNEAIKRSILFVDTKNGRDEQMNATLRKINNSIKISACHGARRTFHINDIKTKEDIRSALQEKGYDVDIQLCGCGRVKFIISW